MGKQEAEKIVKQLNAYQSTATSSRDQAIAALHRAGLVTKTGKPTSQYASRRKSGSKK